ncbi:MAG TPA: endopeptidase La [Terriglobia bacterium]|nr:endopeptidase La [Terriglobia bacterium]
MKRNFEDIEDISQRIHTIPEELPVLPVRDAVIFPNAVIPLNVGRDSSVKLINDVQQGDGMLVVLTQRDKRVDAPAPSDLYEIGTVSMVHRAMKTPEGNLFLIIMGVARVRVDEFTQFEPYLRGKIKTVQDEKEDENSVDFQALRRTVVSQFERIVKLSPQLPDDLQTIVINMEDSSRLADYIATNLPNLSIVSKQFVLERSSVRERLDFLHTELAKELEVLELRSKIQSQVQEEVGKSQREYFLREQLRAIQRELGESDDSQREIEELRQKVEASGMPEEARKEADRELGRLARMSPAAAEYTVSRSYLDWLVALPWIVLTTERIDLHKAKDVLNRDHYDLDKIKERILEYLAVIELKPGGKAPILCFVGPPGVGKTSLGRSIAEAMGRKFVRVSLGGMRDEAEIRGHRRTYIGALPGQVIQNIRRAGSRDPVFMLDEIDKLGTDFRGDPASALLEVLDPEQNSTFRDHYLDVAFDLSRVFFITTANVLDTIPSALRDRMEIIELPGYTEEEKLQIARQYLVPRGRENNGLTPEQIVFEDEALSMVVRHYTRETGVRNLEREISGICRKQARRMLEGRGDQLTVTRAVVEEFLGLPRYRPEEEVEERVNRPGVVVGLAWTPVGGDVLFVEANIAKGARHLTVTGQIGDVMQESTKAALTWVRSKSLELGLDADFYKDMDIHVHVPAGSIPKDGPSAGVTMVTAITSALTNTTIKPSLAMTGEITLSGHVLPVGGIKEKVLAARRAGIRELILPLQNQKNVQEDIQPELLKDIKIHYVRMIDEVLNLAFASAVLKAVQPHSTPQVV